MFIIYIFFLTIQVGFRKVLRILRFKKLIFTKRCKLCHNNIYSIILFIYFVKSIIFLFLLPFVCNPYMYLNYSTKKIIWIGSFVRPFYNRSHRNYCGKYEKCIKRFITCEKIVNVDTHKDTRTIHSVQHIDHSGG